MVKATIINKGEMKMNNSKEEEVISALWAICALLAFGFGFTVWGYGFAAKAFLDMVCSILSAIKENRK